MSTTILSSDRIHTLSHSFFDPSIPPKATLLIVHGMAEHGGRYQQFAQFLASQGIAVLTYDQLGHGRTIATRDELGYFNPQFPMQSLLQDVIIMADRLKARHQDVPHFIMGHSMGSFIVRTVLQHHSSEFAGAILMGTSDNVSLAKALLPITWALNKLKPNQTNTIFAKATNKILNAKLHKKSVDSPFAWVSNNPDNLSDYDADPLCGFDFTNNGFFGLFCLMQRALTPSWADTIDKHFPMLFISGKDDPIGNMGKGIKSLTQRLNRQGFTHIDYQLFTDMRHEPLHEKDHKKVYEAILQWLIMVASNQTDHK